MNTIEIINRKREARRFFGFEEGYIPTEQEVKRKFRELAKRIHPDINSSNQSAGEEMKQLIMYRHLLREPISLEEQYLIKFYDGWF
jgi:hypothetical protein